MKKLLLLSLFIGFSIVATAQTSIKLKMADKKYHHFHYVEAAAIYEDILAGGFNIKAAENLAHCYRKLNDSENAEKWYAQIADKTSADNKLYYAQALAMNGKYEESKRWYDIYAKDVKDQKNHKAPEFVTAYKNMSEFYKDSARYRVQICNFNSEQADFSPMFFRDGLVFVSNRIDSLNTKSFTRHTFKWNNTRFLDLYAVDKPEDTAPHLFHTKSLNTKFHEGPVAFFGAGDSIVFTRNNFHNGKLGKSKDDIHKLKIYFAEGKDNSDEGDWQDIKEFTYNSDQYSTGHPALTPDNNAMYFTSDMPGGYGGTDIYMSTFMNGRWSKPKNLGPDINTKGNEMFPYIDKNNDLYFASNGHAGMGGLDVFVSKAINGKYQKPSNMGAPINSSQDDFALIFDDDNDTGYFTSNRKTGVGDDDIYSFKVKRCKFIGVVLNARTNEVIPDAQVEVFENKNAVGFIPERKDSIFFTFKSRLKTTYAMRANKIGFREGTAQLTEEELIRCLVRGEDISDTIRIYLEPDLSPQISSTYTDPKTGKVYKFKDPNVKVVEITNVYYDFDKYYIRGDANRELERVVQVMNEFPTMMVELSSHTDSRATNYYNIRLAQRRSNAAYNYLIRRGIDPARIRVNSFGENKLIVDCPDFKDCSEEEHQLNRRTEIIILSY